MSAPVSVILLQGFLEEDFYVKLIISVIRDTNTFNLGVWNLVFRLNASFDKHRLHLKLFIKECNYWFLEIPEFNLSLLIDLNTVNEMLLW